MWKLRSKKPTFWQKLQHFFTRKKPENRVTHIFTALTAKYGLPFGIVLAISVALLLTFVSMLLYVVSGTSKLDLSRPGYESVRQQVRRDGESDQAFPSSGVINEQVIKDFLTRFDKETKNLQQYDAFNENLLDDNQIGITDQPSAPTDGANP